VSAVRRVRAGGRPAAPGSQCADRAGGRGLSARTRR